MTGESRAPDADREALERRIAELESALAEAREQVASTRSRLDALVAEQASALAALHTAEKRHGSLPYRLAAELRARLRRGEP